MGIGQRFGRQSATEVWGALFFRYHGFPWDGTVLTTAAVSTGLNWADTVTDVEQERADDGEGSQWMHFFAPEITFALPEPPQRRAPPALSPPLGRLRPRQRRLGRRPVRARWACGSASRACGLPPAGGGYVGRMSDPAAERHVHPLAEAPARGGADRGLLPRLPHGAGAGGARRQRAAARADPLLHQGLRPDHPARAGGELRPHPQLAEDGGDHRRRGDDLRRPHPRPARRHLREDEADDPLRDSSPASSASG